MNQRGWHEDYWNVVAVARYLVEEEGWTAEQLIGFLVSPWRWTEKWEDVQARKVAEKLARG